MESIILAVVFMKTWKWQIKFFYPLGLGLLFSGTSQLWSQALDKRPYTPPPPPPSPALTLANPAPIPPSSRPPTNRPSRPVLSGGSATRPPQQIFKAPQPPQLRPGPVQTFSPTPPNALAWDKDFKQMTAQPNDTNALITFTFTNTHSSEVVIKAVRSSCGCTTVKLPPMPWRVPSGSNGQITANLDLRGRRGVQTKSLMVDSSSGFKSLLFKVTIPPELVTNTVSGVAIKAERVQNMRLALMDRQAIFKNQDCTRCHLDPVLGKTGKELYAAACGICHESSDRATVVPDLKAVRVPTSAPYWRYWMVNGRPGSLMPAFGQSRGGPLTDQQINSLVEFLTETITRNSQTASGARPPLPPRVVPVQKTQPPVKAPAVLPPHPGS